MASLDCNKVHDHLLEEVLHATQGTPLHNALDRDNFTDLEGLTLLQPKEIDALVFECLDDYGNAILQPLPIGYQARLCSM